MLIETLPSKSASHYFVTEKLVGNIVFNNVNHSIQTIRCPEEKHTTHISLIQISSERNFITSVFGFSHINCRNAEKELNLASGFEKYGPLKAIRQLSGCAPQG